MERSDDSEQIPKEIRHASLAFALTAHGGRVQSAESCPKCGGTMFMVTVKTAKLDGRAAICADCKYRAYYQQDVPNG